jgi:hypothetical protein
MPGIFLQSVWRAPQNNGAFRWLRSSRGLAGLANGNADACMDAVGGVHADPGPYSAAAVSAQRDREGK